VIPTEFHYLLFPNDVGGKHVEMADEILFMEGTPEI
jgi:hypothetical protein